MPPTTIDLPKAKVMGGRWCRFTGLGQTSRGGTKQSQTDSLAVELRGKDIVTAAWVDGQGIGVGRENGGDGSVDATGIGGVGTIVGWTGQVDGPTRDLRGDSHAGAVGRIRTVKESPRHLTVAGLGLGLGPGQSSPGGSTGTPGRTVGGKVVGAGGHSGTVLGASPRPGPDMTGITGSPGAKGRHVWTGLGAEGTRGGVGSGIATVVLGVDIPGVVPR